MPTPDLQWPRTHATTHRAEKALARALAPTVDPPAMHKLGWQLDAVAKARIAALGARHGFTTKQAFALRRNMLKSNMPMREFMALGGNSHELAKALADAFEAIVERHVAERCPNTAITTEAQRKAVHAARGGGVLGPTPDLTFEPPIVVNGQPVAWIDCKFMYGSGSAHGAPWQPETKMPATVARYTAAFGPGAFVFANGFCIELESLLKGAMLLDQTPLEAGLQAIDAILEAIDGAEAVRVATTALEAIAGHGAVAAPAVDSLSKGLADSGVAESARYQHTWKPEILPVANISVQQCGVCGAIAQRIRVSNKKREWRVLKGAQECTSTQV